MYISYAMVAQSVRVWVCKSKTGVQISRQAKILKKSLVTWVIHINISIIIFIIYINYNYIINNNYVYIQL